MIVINYISALFNFSLIFITICLYYFQIKNAKITHELQSNNPSNRSPRLMITCYIIIIFHIT